MIFAVVWGLVTLVLVGIVSRYALISVLFDGIAALAILGPPALAGLWLVPLFRLGGIPLRWHFLLGISLGLGFGALLVLTLGLAGFLHRPLWIVIQTILAVVGVLRLHLIWKGTVTDVEPNAGARESAGTWAGDSIGKERDRDPNQEICLPETPLPAATGAKLSPRWSALWILAMPFLVLALLASSNAPGLIRQEEGFGYDVLEYHLQMPKEYFQSGRIEYAPHNVYANFPANVEMYYLLAMILLDDTADVGTVANMIHLILAMLTVYAAWVTGYMWSRRAALIAAMAMATCGWLVYLSGLAYVENGMLFSGMVATAAVLRFWYTSVDRAGHDASHTEITKSRHATGWIVCAGVMAGLACGCKYTAVPMIALPLGLVLIIRKSPLGRKLKHVAVFGAATMASFSPWLVKNQMMTGNPVFPLLNRYVQAAPPGWGDQQTVRWNRGHQAGPEDRGFLRHLAALWRHVPGDHYQRFGPLVLMLPLLGLLFRSRDRVDAALLLLLGTQLAVWLFATHLYARFAVVFLIPFTLLCGRAVLSTTHPASSRRGRVLWVVVATIIGAGWNLAFSASLHRKEGATGAPGSLFYEGKLSGYEYFEVVNNLPVEAKILMIGDAKPFYFKRPVDYCVAFNRNPFVEIIRKAKTDRNIVSWLREQNYTHVLVNWSEVRRLRHTYGFALEITPELFARLEHDGLTLMDSFKRAGMTSPYVQIWRVTTRKTKSKP